MKKSRWCFQVPRGYWRKSWKITKMFSVLMCALTFSVSAAAFAQHERVTLNFRQATVRQVLNEIQRQTRLSFIYNTEQTEQLGQISVEAHNESVTSLLDRILTGTGLTWKIHGPEYIIKPEVSHYGGNAGVTPSGETVTTGVKSFSKDGKMATGVGTSFSTPRVTALAAGIQQELSEEFDPLLIKALITHSASYPKEMTVPVTERAKQVGFGIPKNVPDIIYNSPYEATLILRDSLAKGDKIDIMDFPMPQCLLKDGYYTGQIIATLVYDPVLDPSQGIEYCQSNIDVKFGSYDTKEERDTSKRHILNPVGRKGSQNLLLGTVYSKNKMKEKSSEFALKERLLIQYADKYYPVKKYAVDLSELMEKKKIEYLSPDKKWFLFLQGVYRDHIERMAQIESFALTQEFCLILTIRDPNQKEHVYDEVTQKLDEYNFWHSNIRVATDVNIPL